MSQQLQLEESVKFQGKEDWHSWVARRADLFDLEADDGSVGLTKKLDGGDRCRVEGFGAGDEIRTRNQQRGRL